MTKTAFSIREEYATLSPFKLMSTLKPSEMAKVKVEYERADETIGKKEMYAARGETVEELCFVFKEFQNAAQSYNWQAETRFIKFREVLEDTARDDWDNAIEDRVNNNENTFNSCFRTMIKRRSGDNAYDNLINYLQVAKKASDMTPAQVATRIKKISKYVPFLTTVDGNAPQAFTNRTIVKYTLQAMPEPWIASFKRANLRIQNIELDELVEYMTTLHAEEVEQKAKNKRKGPDNTEGERPNKKSRNDYFRNNVSRNGPGRGNGRNRNNGRGNGGRGHGRNAQRGTRPTDKCPEHPHGNHTWGQCSTNPDSPNYGRIPERQGRGNANGRGRGGRNHQQNQQNYQNQHYHQQPPQQMPQNQNPAQQYQIVPFVQNQYRPMPQGNHQQVHFQQPNQNFGHFFAQY